MLERYTVLLKQLQCQEDALKAYHNRKREYENILTDREVDLINPVLLPSIYDPLRNSAARTFRLSELERIEKKKHDALSSNPKYIAPYLKENVKNQDLRNAYDECVHNMEFEHYKLMDELKKIYEQVNKTSEYIQFIHLMHSLFQQNDEYRHLCEFLDMVNSIEANFDHSEFIDQR